ncbi:MAG: hypothetical protein GF392_00690 [Candidatus Omnitrophica bacterium]|nr:hypothetical protein [Candidatus Omnitrophota bacterium]
MKRHVNYAVLRRKFKLKYAVDRCMASVLIVFTFPVFVFAVFLIKLDGWINPENAGSVFYVEPRISAGRVFNIIKFRTVPREKVKWIREDVEHRSITGSSEVTWAGDIVLNWYMDELPQMFNILKGDMSFIGPRPHVIAQTRQEIEAGLVYRKHIKAGLLGVVQAMKRDKKYKAMFAKMAKTHKSNSTALNKMDAMYADKCLDKSPAGIVLFDLYLIARGIITVFKGVAK